MSKLLIIILAFGTAWAASYNGGVLFHSATSLTDDGKLPEFDEPPVAVMKRDVTGEYKANFAAEVEETKVKRQAAPTLENPSPALKMKRQILPDLDTGEHNEEDYVPVHLNKRQAAAYLAQSLEHVIENAPATKEEHHDAPAVEAAKSAAEVEETKVKRQTAPALEAPSPALNMKGESIPWEASTSEQLTRDSGKHVEKRGVSYYGYPYYGRYVSRGYYPYSYEYYPQETLYYPSRGLFSYLSYL